MKRVISILIALVFCFGLLTACSNNTDVKEGTNQTTAAATDQESSTAPVKEEIKGNVEIALPIGDYTLYTKQVIKRGKFSELFPGIEVNITPEGQPDAFAARIAANDLPNISIPNMGADMVKWINTGKLADLKSLDGASGLLDKLDPAYVNETNGAIYGIPLGADTQLMACNAALFKEAGLDPAKDLETWDQYLAAVQKISNLPARKDGNKVYGFAMWNMALSWGGWYWNMMDPFYMNFNNGTQRLYTADGTDVVIDKQESGFKDFISFMAKAQKYCAPHGDITKFYTDKNIGIQMQHGYGWKNNLRQGGLAAGTDVIFVPVPVFKAGDKHWSALTGRSYAIWKHDAASDNAAWEVIKYLMKDENALAICQGVGKLPTIKAGQDDPFFQEPGEAEFYKQAKEASLLPEDWKSSADVTNDVLVYYNECVVQGKITVDDMIAKLAAKAREDIAKAGK